MFFPVYLPDLRNLRKRIIKPINPTAKEIIPIELFNNVYQGMITRAAEISKGLPVLGTGSSVNSNA